ncbi:MAG: hypothetical protein QXG05_05135 [Nitrososphaerota archaeon]
MAKKFERALGYMHLAWLPVNQPITSLCWKHLAIARGSSPENDVRNIVRGIYPNSDVDEFTEFLYPLYKVDLVLNRRIRSVWLDGKSGKSVVF